MYFDPGTKRYQMSPRCTGRSGNKNNQEKSQQDAIAHV
jgi:hypothetical protein